MSTTTTPSQRLNWRNTVIAIAKSHVGWKEDASRPNRGVWPDAACTYCGAPLGSPYCAASVCYLLHLAGVQHGPRTASTGALEEWASDNNAIRPTAQVGDFILVKGDSATGYVHTALVISGTDQVYQTIEFNEGNSVKYWHREPSSGTIVDPYVLG